MTITQTRRLHCVECIDRIIEKKWGCRTPKARGGEGRGAEESGVWGGGFPLSNGESGLTRGLFPMGRGKEAVPLPRNVFDFRDQNGEIWCILGAIFRVEIGRYCMWLWLEVRGPGAAPSVPRNFWKARGPSKQVRGPGILWLTCNSNSGGMTQYSIHPKQSTICAQLAVYFLHSTMPSVTCLRLSDVSVICRVTYFQFPIQSFW